jgi:hypothetical protein
VLRVYDRCSARGGIGEGTRGLLVQGRGWKDIQLI